MPKYGTFYGSMFVSICFSFLFADVLWSFYGSMFVSISVISFSLQMCCGPLCEYVCKSMLFTSLQMCCGPFMGVCV